MCYIKFENIDKNYGNQHILKDLSLNIHKQEFVTLLGPSGCGKSTLLRCLAGLETISSGKIFLDGEDITHKKPAQRNVGMVFQQYSLFPTMNIYNNIAFGLKIKGYKKQEIDELVKDALKMVNLEGSEKKYPSQLSGGEQQRVAICRCVVTKPKVLLLDEPFSAIDAKLRKSLQTRIKEIHRKIGMTTIFVTHDQDEAMTMSDTIHLMNKGVIEQSGTPTQLYATPKNHFAASFMGNYNILDKNIVKAIANEHISSEEICFRPEVVELSETSFDKDDDSLVLSGNVVDVIPQGNTILYKIKCGDVIIKVSILFDSFVNYNLNSKIFMKIKTSNIIYL